MFDKLKQFVHGLIPQKLINLFFHLPQAIFWTAFYRYPARHLRVIGVTGTDGKTTTAILIWHILITAGKKAGIINTVNARINKFSTTTGLHVTTPSPRKIQQFMRRAVKEKTKYLVLESTSHGLDQYRLWGCNFFTGVITNVTHEHLNYHQTLKKYLQAKGKLFLKLKIAILNRDDWSFKTLLKITQKRGTKIITYGIKNRADFTPQNFSFIAPLPGVYNQYNCLAAIAATSALGIKLQIIHKALKTFTPPPGRLEAIKKGQNFRVYVDFAHTPNGLKSVLALLHLRLKKKQKLIAVFGAAGLRDKTKRPLMGKIAGKNADISVITAEDPRTEGVKQIIDQIVQGSLAAGAKEIKYPNKLIYRSVYKLSQGKHYFLRVPDRRKAISLAIKKIAQKGDIVVICGKGPEKSINIGKTEYPWSDKKEAEKAIKLRNA